MEANVLIKSRGNVKTLPSPLRCALGFCDFPKSFTSLSLSLSPLTLCVLLWLLRMKQRALLKEEKEHKCAQERKSDLTLRPRVVPPKLSTYFFRPFPYFSLSTGQAKRKRKKKYHPQKKTTKEKKECGYLTKQIVSSWLREFKTFLLCLLHLLFYTIQVSFLLHPLPPPLSLLTSPHTFL